MNHTAGNGAGIGVLFVCLAVVGLAAAWRSLSEPH